MSVARHCLAGLTFAATALPALGQDTLPSEAIASAPARAADNDLTFGSQGEGGRPIVFSAFLGLQADPAYFGSEDFELGASFRGGLIQLNIAGIDIGTIGTESDPYERRQGFAYGLSLRYVQGRDSDEYDEIRGLDDIDPTLEVGAGVGYAWPSFETVAVARYGIGGSDAWVGELAANYVARPADRLVVRVGPRLLFGSERYVDTYFGVSASESVASGLPAYEPDAGPVGAGVEVIATYRVSERWWLEAGVEWQRFLDDAADSPIVEDGAEDFTEFRIGVRRAFSIRF